MSPRDWAPHPNPSLKPLDANLVEVISDLKIHRFSLRVQVSEHVYLVVLQKATIIYQMW